MWTESCFEFSQLVLSRTHASPSIVLASLLRRAEMRGARRRPPEGPPPFAKVAEGQVGDFVTGPPPHLGFRERTTSAEWKEEAHTVLMNISKHSALATQTVLFGFRPTMCKRFWWLLVRHRGLKASPA